MDNVKDFISVQEAAQISGYNKRTITYLCNRGDLPGAFKIGHQWLIPKKAIKNYKPGPQGFAAIKKRKEQIKNKNKNSEEKNIMEKIIMEEIAWQVRLINDVIEKGNFNGFPYPGELERFFYTLQDLCFKKLEEYSGMDFSADPEFEGEVNLIAKAKEEQRPTVLDSTQIEKVVGFLSFDSQRWEGWSLSRTKAYQEVRDFLQSYPPVEFKEFEKKIDLHTKLSFCRNLGVDIWNFKRSHYFSDKKFAARIEDRIDTLETQCWGDVREELEKLREFISNPELIDAIEEML